MNNVPNHQPVIVHVVKTVPLAPPVEVVMTGRCVYGIALPIIHSICILQCGPPSYTLDYKPQYLEL